VVPFPPCGTPLLGCLLAWTLVLAPRFLFSPFLGCFHSIKFGKVSSSSVVGTPKVLFVLVCDGHLLIGSSQKIIKSSFGQSQNRCVQSPLWVAFVSCKRVNLWAKDM
jgi:hypothetical protein